MGCHSCLSVAAGELEEAEISSLAQSKHAEGPDDAVGESVQARAYRAGAA